MLVQGVYGSPRSLSSSSAVRASAAASPKAEVEGPVKRLSAYNLFVKERYSAYKAENPDTDLKAMSKHWKSLSEDDKQPFKSRVPPPAPKVKPPKEPKTPKKPGSPVTAYTLFVKETYPALKAKDPSANIGSVGALYKQLAPADKDKFKQRAAEMAEEFYKENPKPEKVPRSKKSKPDGPSRPPSAYNNFIKAEYPKMAQKAGAGKQAFAALAVQWKTMSVDQKAAFK